MSAAEQLGISEELLRLIDRALSQALPILRESGEAFNPFVLLEGGDRPQLQRVMAPEPEQAVEAARELIGRQPAAIVRYALAFDGRITDDDGDKADAIVVEAGERGSDFGVVVGLRYRLVEDGPAEEVGNPTSLGRSGNYFAAG